MNCKKGEIAMYIGRAPELAHLRGHLFLCVEWIVDREGRSGWRTEPPPHPDGEGFQDHVLRPIRDPGPDTVDEMVQIMRSKAPSPEFVGQAYHVDQSFRSYNGWAR